MCTFVRVNYTANHYSNSKTVYIAENTPKISICQMHYNNGRHSSVHKVHKLDSQQVIAAAQQVTPPFKLYIFHYTLIVTRVKTLLL